MEVIKEMVSIGFTEYEAKAYYNLLKKNNFSASELARISNIPRTKIYSIFESLIDKGACIEIPGKVKKYRAVSPEIAFKKTREQLEEKASMINTVSQLLVPIFEMKRDNYDPLDYIEIIRDKNSMKERLNQLDSQSKSEIITMNKPPFISRLGNIHPTRIGENVTYKFIDEIVTPLSTQVFDYWETLITEGIKVRMTSHLPIKMVIYDRKTIVLGLRDNVPGKDSITNMIIEHNDLAITLGEIFDIYWQKSVSFEEYCEMEQVNLPQKLLHSKETTAWEHEFNV